ncbi:UNVERIFIED_CONTAM: hypothetical protein GTU68_003615 [Idotea baltica]|nr:hypothetical protein [Idotea baltica]
MWLNVLVSLAPPSRGPIRMAQACLKRPAKRWKNRRENWAIVQA